MQGDMAESEGMHDEAIRIWKSIETRTRNICRWSRSGC